MDPIRAFIALHLPVTVREVLDAVSQELARSVPSRAVTWVKPERIHLTLRFLGDTPVEKLDEVAAGLDAVAANHEPFDLVLDRLGCFPNERRPRVIWVGVEGKTERLQAIKRDIDAMLAQLGWAREKKAFSAHLTLGRIKRHHDRVNLPWGSAVVPQPFSVNKLYLVESELRPQGPRYTVRHSSSLG